MERYPMFQSPDSENNYLKPLFAGQQNVRRGQQQKLREQQEEEQSVRPRERRGPRGHTGTSMTTSPSMLPAFIGQSHLRDSMEQAYNVRREEERRQQQAVPDPSDLEFPSSKSLRGFRELIREETEPRNATSKE